MGSSPEYSVVIPCYRSGTWIDELVERVSAAMSGLDYEIVLVNDASPDNETWPAIRKAASKNDRIHGIDLARNVGQFSALMCGLAESKGRRVITMDDDLQHPPEEIPRLIEALDDDVDVVIGAYESKNHQGWRNLGTGLMDRLFREAYGKPDDLRMGSFRLLRRSVVDTMLTFGTTRPVPGALILQSTSRIRNVSVEHHARLEGQSGYSIRRLVSSTVDNLINASTMPLRLISGLGLLTAGIAAVALIYYLLRALFANTAVPGFSTTVILISFFGGATLLAVGVVGEYVARIVAETADPPLYAIREHINQPDDELT